MPDHLGPAAQGDGGSGRSRPASGQLRFSEGSLISNIEPRPVPLHRRSMSRIKLAASPMPAMVMFALVASAPLRAENQQKTVMDGRCEYSDRVARHHNETTLILCDKVTIGRSAAIATLDFVQRSWGSMAQFTGEMPGHKMTIFQITLRDRGPIAATGTCEIFHQNDGRLSVISCLAKAGSRSIAASFIPSRL